jgi:hypothetical protein
MTIDPKVSEDARTAIVLLAEKLIARSQRGLPLTALRSKEDVKDIASDDPQSNYPGVRGAYLATLRLRIDPEVYETLLDGPLYLIASSRALEELAQNVADQASDPQSIDGESVKAQLEKIANEDLGAGIKAVRGAFLAYLEEVLPHRSEAYDTLLAGELSFLVDV